MDDTDKKHILFTCTLFAVSASFFLFEIPIWVSVLTVIVMSFYIVLLFVQCSFRAKQKEGDTPNTEIFILPNRAWALLLVLLFININVLSFSNLYIESKGIYDQNKECDNILKTKENAIYFSSVTLTTLGYGEFIPNEKGRLWVVFQLASGLLILLIIIPVVASRATTWR